MAIPMALKKFGLEKAIAYMLPLIRGEYPSTYRDGIPVHFVFDERQAGK